MNTPYIIAEIGSNWRTFEDAKRQIFEANIAGASAVKFQMFTLQELFGPDYKTDAKCYGLPFELVEPLADYCEDVGIDFLCSAFSIEGFKFVDMFVKMHKVASPEALDLNIRDFLLFQAKPVIWSNGCAEIFWASHKDVVMECVSKYPAKLTDYSLRKPIRGRLGLSDHTLDTDLARLFRNSECMFFEKHVDFLMDKYDDNMPDRCVSIGGEEFRQYVKAIKQEPVTIREESAKLYGRQHQGPGYFRPSL